MLQTKITVTLAFKFAHVFASIGDLYFFVCLQVTVECPFITPQRIPCSILTCVHVHLLSCDQMDCGPLGSSVHGISQASGCHFLLQGIFLTQGWNPGLPHCRQMLLPSEPPGKSSHILWELINCVT